MATDSKKELELAEQYHHSLTYVLSKNFYEEKCLIYKKNVGVSTHDQGYVLLYNIPGKNYLCRLNLIADDVMGIIVYFNASTVFNDDVIFNNTMVWKEEKCINSLKELVYSRYKYFSKIYKPVHVIVKIEKINERFLLELGKNKRVLHNKNYKQYLRKYAHNLYRCDVNMLDDIGYKVKYIVSWGEYLKNGDELFFTSNFYDRNIFKASNFSAEEDSCWYCRHNCYLEGHYRCIDDKYKLEMSGFKNYEKYLKEINGYIESCKNVVLVDMMKEILIDINVPKDIVGIIEYYVV